MKARADVGREPSQPRVPDSRLPGADPDAEQKRSQSSNESENRDISILTLWPVLVLVVLAITVGVLTVLYGPTRVLQKLLQYTVPKDPQPWHAVAIWSAIVACIVLAIPVLLMLLPVPTLIFGFWQGFLITFFALVCAAGISFFVGRYMAQRPVRDFLKGKGCRRTMRMLRVLEDEEESMKLLILYRFLMIPMSVRNYGPSILSVPMQRLMLSTIPHSLWSATVFATAGTALEGPAKLLRDGQKITWKTPQWQQILGFTVAACSLSFFSWIAYRTYTRKIRLEEDDQDEASNLAFCLKSSEDGGHQYGTDLAPTMQTSAS